MTKTKQQETEIVTATEQNTSVAIFDVAMLQQDSGAGRQNVQQTDMATPIISILQANSPQCKKSDGKYIKGASEGMLFNNVTNEIYDGEKGITVIPCYFEKVFIEWKPNRGGFAGIHEATTPLKAQLISQINADGKEVSVLPNGNELVETNQHYVLLIDDNGQPVPAVIAMTSTALKSSRIWNTLMAQVTIDDGKGGKFIPASYYMQYKLSAKPRVKDTYSWFGWEVAPIGPVPSQSIYMAGRSFEKAISQGAVKVKQERADETVEVQDDKPVKY